MLAVRSVKQLIGSMAKTGEIPQAILVTGKKQGERREVAGLLCRYLFCERPSAEGPCGTCPSCLKIGGGNHPDVIRVEHESPDVIKVDDIRSQVADTVSIRPYYGKRKVYVIDDADLMNPAAQNALLKTLEEPPEYCILLLLAADPSQLLPTVRSRVVRIDLMAETELRMTAQETESEEYRETVELCRGISRMAGYEAALKAKELSQKTEDTDRILDLIELWYRDALRIRVTGSMAGIGFSGEKGALSEAARQVSAEGVSEICKAVELSRRMLKANVNKEAVLELLLMKMRETK